MYKILSEKSVKYGKFNVDKKLLKVKVFQNRKNDFYKSISSIFDDILNKHILTCESYKIGLVIHMKNLNPDLCIEFMFPRDLSGKVITDRLSKVIQSNKTINVNNITIEATYFKLKANKK